MSPDRRTFSVPEESTVLCRTRSTLSLAVAAVLCLVPATGAVAQSDPVRLSTAVVDSMPLPSGRVTGLAWLAPDTVLVLTDVPDSVAETGRRQVLLTYQTPAGEVLRQEDFTDTLDRGLSYDGEFIWACGDEDEGGSLLYMIEPDTCYVKEAYPTPTHRPCDLSWDGRFLWVSDRDSGRLDRFDPESEKFTRSVVAPGFSPHGLAWDGRHAWVTDSAIGQLYRLYGNRRRWNGTVSADDFSFRDRDVVLTWGGGALWYVAAADSLAYRLSFQ